MTTETELLTSFSLKEALAQFVTLKREIESRQLQLQSLENDISEMKTNLSNLGLSISEKIRCDDIVCAARINGRLYAFDRRSNADDHYLVVVKLLDIGEISVEEDSDE